MGHQSVDLALRQHAVRRRFRGRRLFRTHPLDSKPGNELFIVLTQNWQNLGMGLFERDRDLVTLSRGASVKLNYTVRF